MYFTSLRKRNFTFLLSPILAIGLMSCGDSSNLDSSSKLHEAPNQINSYQRIGMQTKAYNAVNLSGQLTNTRNYWSGFYWPHYKGGLSQRWQQNIASTSYRDHLYPIQSFQSYQYMQPYQVQRLSPSEKYDLWMNDYYMRFTHSERRKVLATAQQNGGKIPTWYGLCDGWALASAFESEPIRMVQARSASGKIIDFYPEDIKGLLAHYYATAPKNFLSSGGRCNRKTVTKDANGRVIESECRDVNPSTFHLALDRYVGQLKSNLIIDIARDEMVWNYPVYSYKFDYKNLRPLTKESNYIHAAPGTQYLVDVTAYVDFVGGVGPTTQLGHQRKLDRYTWRYVLELDRWQRIIGGEWISNQHPDFMWIVQGVHNNHTSAVDYRSLSVLTKASQQP